MPFVPPPWSSLVVSFFQVFDGLSGVSCCVDVPSGSVASGSTGVDSGAKKHTNIIFLASRHL